MTDSPPEAGVTATGPYDPAAGAASATDLSELDELLSRAYSMIQGMLRRLRESQSVLQRSAVQKLHDTSAKLHEVTSATESAATDIMDGLDRALALIDRLEGGAAPAEVSAELRDEIFGAMNHLQFQDITAQQLRYASALLQDMEAQMAGFASLFDQAGHHGPPPALPVAAARPTYDPGATVWSAERRQALVDELIGR